MKLTTIVRLALSVAGVAVSGCGLSEPPPFSPGQIQQIQKEQADQVPPARLKPLPTSFESLMPPGATMPTTMPVRTAKYDMGPTVKLTLQEVIHRAVVNSLDVRVAGYEPAIDEVRILEARSRFDPVFFSNGQFQKEYQQTGVGGNMTPPEVLSQQIQTGIKQNLTDGGQIELRGQARRQEVDSDTLLSGVNPFYQNELVLQLTQPLLRDFGGKVNRARVTIAQNDQRISQLDWRDKLEQAVFTIEEGYWRLYQAKRNLEIQEELLKQTEDTLDILIKRLKQDTTRLQVSQGNAAVQSRRAELWRARQEIGNISDQIKRIMCDPDLPVASALTIAPADAPMEEAVQYSLGDQIQAASENRFDLLQQAIRVMSAREIVWAAKNNALPQLNLTGSVGLQGLGADFDDAADRQRRTDQFVYTVGLSFEVPIGNRGPRAIYQRTLLQHQQAILQYRTLVEEAGLQVKKAYREVETAWNEIIATRHARFAAKDALEAIEQRERSGETLRPEFVQLKLDRQEALAMAWRAEVQSIVNYNIAVAGMEKAKGTLLRYNNVIMKEEGGGKPTAAVKK